MSSKASRSSADGVEVAAVHERGMRETENLSCPITLEAKTKIKKKRTEGGGYFRKYYGGVHGFSKFPVRKKNQNQKGESRSTFVFRP